MRDDMGCPIALKTCIRRWSFLLVIVAAALAGCKEHSTQTESVDPYQRWRSYNLHNYTIDQIHQCFCLDGGAVMRIVVRADTISFVRRMSDSSIVPLPNASRYLTVDSLFGKIKNPRGDSLVVSYHPVFGFPEKLDINPQQHPVDGGVLIETFNLQVP